jgi:hypothetical protein
VLAPRRVVIGRRQLFKQVFDRPAQSQVLRDQVFHLPYARGVDTAEPSAPTTELKRLLESLIEKSNWAFHCRVSRDQR